MLETIRRFAKTWPAKLLFGGLVLSFGLWGVAGKLFSSTDATAVVTVGGQRVEAADLQRAYTQQMAQVAKQNGADFQPTAAMRQQVAAASLQQLVLQSAIAAYLKRLGTVAPDQAVREQTFALGAFRNAAGKFDRTTFLAVLQKNNMTEQQFITAMQSDVARQQFLGAADAAVAAPEPLVDALFSFTHESRTADAVVIPLAGAPAPADPTEAQLRRYWTNHQEGYRQPEYRRIRAVILSPQTIAKGETVPDADIQRYYTAEEAVFNKPERRSVQVLIVPTQAAAATLAKAWQGGADWAAMQTQAAGVPGTNAIELPNAKQIELPDPVLGKAAFAAAQDSVAGPVKGDFGWFVVKVTAVTPASFTTLAQATPDIRTKLGVLKANDEIDDHANKLEDALAGGGKLDTLPGNLGAAAVQGTLDAQGNTPDGTPAPIPAQDALRQAIITQAFRLKRGEPVQLQQLAASKADPAGAYYGVEVESITPAASRPYEQVAPAVKLGWLAEQGRHMQEAVAAALLHAVQGGTPISTAATAAHLTAIALPPVRRMLGGEPPPAGVPTSLVAPLFTLRKGEATMVETPDGFMVAQLRATDTPPVSSDPVSAAQLRASLNHSVSLDMDDLMVGALRNGVTVSAVNTQLLQQVTQN